MPFVPGEMYKFDQPDMSGHCGRGAGIIQSCGIQSIGKAQINPNHVLTSRPPWCLFGPQHPTVLTTESFGKQGFMANFLIGTMPFLEGP